MEAVEVSTVMEDLLPVPAPELPPDRFLDRELSWLAFNNRVLDLAKDAKRVPLLGRDVRGYSDAYRAYFERNAPLAKEPKTMLDAALQDRLARLVSLVPCFHLDLGCDLASVPSGVEAVLAQVRPS